MADLPNDLVTDRFGLFNDWPLNKFSCCSKLHLQPHNNKIIDHENEYRYQ